jgi:hypothetical protein
LGAGEQRGGAQRQEREGECAFHFFHFSFHFGCKLSVSSLSSTSSQRLFSVGAGDGFITSPVVF